MEWLIWVIVIVLVIALVWWLVSRRAGGQAPESTSAGTAAEAGAKTPAGGESETAAARGLDEEHRQAGAAGGPVDVDDWAPETEAPAEELKPSAKAVHDGDVDDWDEESTATGYDVDAANLDAGERTAAADRPAAYAVKPAEEPAAAEPEPAVAEPAPAVAEPAPAVAEPPFGEGSAAALPDGSAPAGFPVKGVSDSFTYHDLDSDAYAETAADVWFVSDAHAEAAGFRRARNQSRKPGGPAFSFAAPVAPGPYGEGSADPKADGTGPAGFMIKADEDAMVFHGPDSPAYAGTEADVWFRTSEDAEKAGFRRYAGE